MTVDEIFSKVASHMIEGIMVHDQLAIYYDFLQLKGYKRCHEYHFLCENVSYRGINRYFTNHYNKMIVLNQIPDPAVIPSSWYKYSRQDVDTNTKRSAVKAGYERWVEWEKSTKLLYESLYKELIDINEIAGAKKLEELICDVDHELKIAERKSIDLKTIDYNISDILNDQDKEHDKYKRKMKKIGASIC